MRFDDMQKLMATLEARLGRSWWTVVEHLRDQNQLGDVEARIAVGDIEGAVSGIADAATKFAADAGAAYAHAGQVAAKWLDGEVSDSLVRFDVTNTRAVQAMQQSSLQLRGAITSESQQVIRRVITDGLADGTNPRDIARDIRSSIGLTDWQAQQVQSYRQLLESGDATSLRAATARQLSDGRHDRSLQRMASDGIKPTAAQVDAMTERYRQNWVAFRAETIARTEGLRAANQGTEEAYRQAIANGDIDADSLTREWNTAHDPRVRSSHRAMNGQKRPLGAMFTTGDGVNLRYPGDPEAPIEETAQCRCVLSTRVVALPSSRRADVVVPDAPTPPMFHAPVTTAPEPVPAIAERTVLPMSNTQFADARKRFLASTTEDEQAAALHYSSNDYENINGLLRRTIDANSLDEDQIAKIQQTVVDLDTALAKTPIEEPVITWRGSSPHASFMKLEPGQIFIDEAYLSTTTDEDVPFDGGVIFHITSPSGTKIGAIPSEYSNEKEMLLARGTALRLDKREKIGPNTHLHVTVVGQR